MSYRVYCVFFDDTTFCFAEMKFESESISDLTIQNNRTKAVRQLRSTFGIFQKAFDDNFLGLTLEAYVCTPEHYPKKGSAIESHRVDFLEDLGVRLFETNEKTF